MQRDPATPTRTCRPAASRAAPSDAVVRVEGKIKDPRAVRPHHRRAAAAAARSTWRRSPTSIDGEKEHDSISRINGQPGDHARHPARRRTPTSSRPAQACKAAVEALQEALPPDVELRIVFYAAGLRSSAASTASSSTIIEGALLTVLIVFLFLHSLAQHHHHRPDAADRGDRARSSRMYAFGFTLNFMTLMALSLCIGLLIDDAIVVRENIVRHLAHGQGPPPRRARRHRRDRPRGDGDDVRDRRGVRAGRLHERHHRQVLLPVRHHRRGGGAGVAVRQLHARPDAVVGLARPAADRASSACRGSAACMDARRAAASSGVHRRATASVLALGARRTARRVARRSRSSIVRRQLLRCVPLVGTRVRAAGRRELHLAAPQHAGGLEPRVHRRARCSRSRRCCSEFPEVDARRSTTVGTERRPQLRARQPASSSTAQRAHAARRRSSRARSASASQPIAGHRARGRLQPPDLGHPARPRPGRADAADRRVRATRSRKIPGIADLETSSQGAPTRRSSIRLNNERGRATWASPCSRSAPTLRPLLAGDDGQLLARRPTARTTRSTCSCRSDRRQHRVRPRQPVPRDQQARTPTARRAWCRCARSPSSSSRRSPQIIKRQDLQRRVAHLRRTSRAARPATSATTCRRSSRTIDAAARLPLRRRRPGQRTWRSRSARRSAALGLAVIFIYMILASQFGSFLQPLAIMASLPLSLIGVLLALLLTGTHAQHLLDHRLHHADGPGDQERDPAGRLRQPARAARGASAARCAAATRARCGCGRS